MKVLGKIVDHLRTLVGIRRVRHVAPAREKPSVGSSLVRDQLRIRVKYAIDDEFWDWLALKGWRLMPLHNNRRRYTMVPERIFIKLIRGDLATRESIDRRFVRAQGAQTNARPPRR